MPQTQVKSLGGVDTGVHNVNLTFPNFTANDSDVIVMNYLIVNSGGDNSVDVELALERVGRALANGTLGAPTPPQLSSAMAQQATADWLALQLQGIYRSGCDGLCAAEQDSFTFSNLSSRASPNPFTQTTTHVGTETSHQCTRAQPPRQS